MGMNVDEAGRERESIARDSLEALAVAEIADQCDASIHDCEIGCERRTPQTVENVRALVYGMQQERLA